MIGMHLHGFQQRTHVSPCLGPRMGCQATVYHNRRLLQVPSSLKQQRTAIRAVTGQVRETTSNGNGSAASNGRQEPLAKQQTAEAPKIQFNWFKQWYPVAVLDDLDPRLPMPAKILGLDLAIWWDSNANQWR